mgnify:CR=1 FL=1
MPCEGAYGLLPGRAELPGRGPPEPPGRGMPCEGAYGLLPGRASRSPRPSRPSRPELGRAAGPGRGPGVGPPGVAEAADVRAAGAAGSSGAPAAGEASAVRAAGAGASAGAGADGSASGVGEAAGAPGFGPPDRRPADVVGCAADGLAASGVGAGDAEAYFSRRRRSTGASMVEDADLTYSPIVFSSSSRFLLLVPSSRASSCTRVLATTLLLRVHPGKGGPRSVVRAHC